MCQNPSTSDKIAMTGDTTFSVLAEAELSYFPCRVMELASSNGEHQNITKVGNAPYKYP